MYNSSIIADCTAHNAMFPAFLLTATLRHVSYGMSSYQLANE